jgi:hypothetical protein
MRCWNQQGCNLVAQNGYKYDWKTTTVDQTVQISAAHSCTYSWMSKILIPKPGIPEKQAYIRIFNGLRHDTALHSNEMQHLVMIQDSYPAMNCAYRAPLPLSVDALAIFGTNL